MSKQTLKALESEIRACQICVDYLPLGPRPVFSVHQKSRILVIGQAPGTKVHASGIPWDDASGKELRRWMGVTSDQFYNPELFGIVPMGFCYPGRGKGGDLPPRPECAPAWHDKLFAHLSNVELVLLIGQYAQKYYLGNTRKSTLTQTVQNFSEYLPKYLPLVHPSPRNRIWQKKNPWFEEEIVPMLRERVHELI